MSDEMSIPSEETVGVPSIIMEPPAEPGLASGGLITEAPTISEEAGMTNVWDETPEEKADREQVTQAAEEASDQAVAETEAAQEAAAAPESPPEAPESPAPAEEAPESPPAEAAPST